MMVLLERMMMRLVVMVDERLIELMVVLLVDDGDGG